MYIEIFINYEFILVNYYKFNILMWGYVYDIKVRIKKLISYLEDFFIFFFNYYLFYGLLNNVMVIIEVIS